MKIYKFGGASIKDVQSIRNVVNILQQEGTDKCLLVISAAGKMTNAFEEVVHAYCYDKLQIIRTFEHIRAYHLSIVNKLFDNENDLVLKELNELFKNLKNTLTTGFKVDGYDFAYDQIVCYGELISTTIVSHYLNAVGLDTVWNDVRKLIHTDSSYRDAKVNWNRTKSAIQEKVNTNKLNIVQGFLGGDANGNTTTLGREGSDYTAGIFAYCLNADSVTIWKDVPGVLNADPRVFKKIQVIQQISYEETIEMAFYGASVIHPKTVQPLQSKNIPLFVRSFVDKELPGTKVTRGVAISPKLPCFIVKKDQILVSISSRDFSFMVENKISHLFKLLHQHVLKVNLIQNSAISFSVCVDNKFNQFDTFYQELEYTYKVEVIRGVDLYTIRYFDNKAIKQIHAKGTPVLTQINKETAQIVIKN